MLSWEKYRLCEPCSAQYIFDLQLTFRTLVSTGATSLARRKFPDSLDGLLVEPESLISSRASEEWLTWLERDEKSADSNSTHTTAVPKQDTVGAVALDRAGNASSAVSRSVTMHLGLISASFLISFS